jgi:hypothetical protein
LVTIKKLYKLNNEQRDQTNFYSRDPNHIIEVIEMFREELKPEEINNPQIQGWVKKKPSIEDMIEVKFGDLIFQAGMVEMNDVRDGESFFERLPVTDDFTVHVNLESLPYFDHLRRELPDNKMGKLYAFHNVRGLFPSQNFIPEDVMKAVVNFDLKPYYEKAKPALKHILEASNHTGIHVSFRPNT